MLTLPILNQLKSILFILTMAILLVPWSLLDFCITHPLGHEHHPHEPDKPTPCELRAKAMQESNGPAIWPPMDCQKINVDSDDFEFRDGSRIKPNTQTYLVLIVLFDLHHLEFSELPKICPPEPNCRSATLLSDSPLRAPPLV
jgi:hypothetical protein